MLAGGVEALGTTLLRGLETERAAGEPPPGEAAAFLLLARGSDAAVRVGAFATGSGTGFLEQALADAGLVWGDVDALWVDGDAPSAPVRVVNVARAAGDCGAAGGVLAAVAAAHSVARTGRPALAASLPPDGTRSALVLVPA